MVKKGQAVKTIYLDQHNKQQKTCTNFCELKATFASCFALKSIHHDSQQFAKNNVIKI